MCEREGNGGGRRGLSSARSRPPALPWRRAAAVRGAATVRAQPAPPRGHHSTKGAHSPPPGALSSALVTPHSALPAGRPQALLQDAGNELVSRLMTLLGNAPKPSTGERGLDDSGEARPWRHAPPAGP